MRCLHRPLVTGRPHLRPPPPTYHRPRPAATSRPERPRRIPASGPGTGGVGDTARAVAVRTGRPCRSCGLREAALHRPHARPGVRRRPAPAGSSAGADPSSASSTLLGSAEPWEACSPRTPGRCFRACLPGKTAAQKDHRVGRKRNEALTATPTSLSSTGGTSVASGRPLSVGAVRIRRHG